MFVPGKHLCRVGLSAILYQTVLLARIERRQANGYGLIYLFQITCTHSKISFPPLGEGQGGVKKDEFFAKCYVLSSGQKTLFWRLGQEVVP
jgi:uncharacterized membrane protein